jgi:hypothetical protein
MRQRSTFLSVGTLLWGAVLLACPGYAVAQRHGGGGAGEGGFHGISRPDGVDEKDSLKDFHHSLAVQATIQQMAEFRVLIKSTEAAKAELEKFRRDPGKGSGIAQPAQNEPTPTQAADQPPGSALDQALEKSRSGTKAFVSGFSEAQKSGLKEITKRLDKADSDLEQEEKNLDLSAPGAAAMARSESLDKALTDFYNQQLALGREMGITQASGQDLIFNLPAVKSPANIASRAIAVTVSGALSQISSEGGQRTFKLELLANLGDLQQNMTQLLRAQMDNSDRCGERVAVRQAMFTPAAPASVVLVQLHYERWTCVRMSGRVESNEVAESDGSVEIKLTPSVENENGLKLAAEFSRVDAGGMLGDALRSGNVGDDLREKVAQSVLTAMRAGVDFKTTLPPAVQNAPMIESAKFHDSGSGQLSLVLEGKVQITNAQADALASQLNQTLSAQGTPSQ